MAPLSADYLYIFILGPFFSHNLTEMYTCFDSGGKIWQHGLRIRKCLLVPKKPNKLIWSKKYTKWLGLRPIFAPKCYVYVNFFQKMHSAHV